MHQQRQFVLTIDTDNAAFDDDPAPEVARILRDLADSILWQSAKGGALHDINGNRVGTCGFMSADEVEQRGAKLAEVFRLRTAEKRTRFLTMWGDKTPMGVYLTAQRILNEEA